MKKATKVCLLYEGKLLDEPRNPTELLASFPRQNVLIVGMDNSVSKVVKNYNTIN